MVRFESESLPSRRRVFARFDGVTLAETRYDPNLRLPRHAHEFAKISLIVRGGVSETSSRGEHAAGPGDVVFKPAGIDHTDAFAPGETLIFSIIPGDSDDGEILGSATKSYEWVRSPAVTRTMFAALIAFRRCAVGDALPLDEALYELAAFAPHARAGSGRPSTRSRLFDDACDYIGSNCERALQVREIAQQVGTHPIYLTRLFRQRLGCNVSAFVRRERLRRAAELLAGTDRPPAQVAAAVGFADQPHFCRTLRKEFGLTPVAYRTLFRG